MSHDWFDPPMESTNVVLIDEELIRRAEARIQNCEFCHRDTADIPLDWVFDQLTNCDPSNTDYVLSRPAGMSNVRFKDHGESLGCRQR